VAIRRGQRVHRRADDPLGAQPVAGQLQQHAEHVMLQRTCEQELVELLTLTRRAPAPAQPGQHLGTVIAAGAALPAAVASQQHGRGRRVDRESGT